MSNKNMKTTENKAQPKKKRLSSISHPNEDLQKPGKKRYRALLICSICDGDAHGYNFDAISCESCKAFFRRNAFRPLEKLKCHGDGHCNVNNKIKKRCKRCRLRKCIQQGMRKEWILSTEEKEEKRTKIEENRRLKQSHEQNSRIDRTAASIDSNLFLTDHDWLSIQLIQDTYTDAVKLNQIAGIAFYPSIQPIESTFDLFRIPLYISSMRLITFLKQADHFQRISKNDQLHLIKANLICICFYHSMYAYDPRRDCYHEEDTTDPLFSGKDWNKTLNNQFHLEIKRLRTNLIDIFQLDNNITKLFMFIILFSQQMSFNQSFPLLYNNVDSLSIFKAQNLYTDILYRYCLQHYGPLKAPLLFARYTFNLMKLQDLVDDIKYHIHEYMDVTELSPLVQSLVM